MPNKYFLLQRQLRALSYLSLFGSIVGFVMLLFGVRVPGVLVGGISLALFIALATTIGLLHGLSAEPGSRTGRTIHRGDNPTLFWTAIIFSYLTSATALAGTFWLAFFG